MLTFRDYISFAENFLRKAKRAARSGESEDEQGLLMGSFLFSWITLETFVNNMMTGFSDVPEENVLPHERAFMKECTLVFAESGHNAGRFVVSKQKRFVPLEHRILFLVAKFSKGPPVDRGGELWQEFKKMGKRRNQLTHPRKLGHSPVTQEAASKAIDVAKAMMSLLSQRIYGETIDF